MTQSRGKTRICEDSRLELVQDPGHDVSLPASMGEVTYASPSSRVEVCAILSSRIASRSSALKR